MEVGALLLLLGAVVAATIIWSMNSKPAEAPAPEIKVVAPDSPWVADSPQFAVATGVPAPQGLAAIDAFHANDLNAVEIRIADCANITEKSYIDVATVMLETMTGRSRHHDHSQGVQGGVGAAMLVAGSITLGFKGGKAERALKSTVLRRSLRDMTDAERGVLRLADLLLEIQVIDAWTSRLIRTPIVWNEGKCYFESAGYDNAGQKAALKEGLLMLLGAHFGDFATASELVQTALRRALSAESGLPAEYRHLFERYLFGGSRWLSPSEATASANSPTALKLGMFEGTQQDLYYDRVESLVTIAPPGSGKSQAHVIRNLLNLRAPAVVLDIKGEVAASTMKWRQANVGKAIFFVPTRPDYSSHYNPMDGVRDDPETAWDDARRLADLLVVPQHGDPYFENRARDLLTVAILDIALTEPPENRNVTAILDRIYVNDKEFQGWLEHLKSTGVPHLARQAAAWENMSAPQRDGIFDSARRHMEVWQSPALASLTTRSDWRPPDVRNENATLYLCVRLEDVKKFAPVLRVIIGQTVAGLCNGEAEANAQLVTFFLDELPRLGRMDVIEEALDIGRGFGVRLWLFCQNTGQLRIAYPNADGMIGNCAARCYMDPDDEAAEELSRYLGQRKGLLDGRQKPLAEPTDLKGPAFADKIIVLQRGLPPAKLVRRMAFAEQQPPLRVAEPA